MSAEETEVRSPHCGCGEVGDLTLAKDLNTTLADSFALTRGIGQDFVGEWVVLALLGRAWRGYAQALEPPPLAQKPSAMSGTYCRFGLPKEL